MIDAELYRIFYIVTRCGTVSAAAEQLHVSQPAVSKSIKKLEELSGCTLFIRSSKGVSLTTEGEILYDYVKNGFEYLENGEQILQKIRNKEEGLIKIGISNTLCKYLFIPCLEQFHKSYPGIRINIINRTSPETLSLLERGAIDFGITSIPKNLEHFSCRELLTIQDVFVAGAYYPQLQSPQTLQSLAHHPLMMLEKNNVTRTYIDAFLADHNAVLHPEIEISSLDFLVDFARIGIGVALVIRNFIEKELELGILREIDVVPPIPPRKVGVVQLKNMALSNSGRAFLEYLCDSVNSSPNFS